MNERALPGVVEDVLADRAGGPDHGHAHLGRAERLERRAAALAAPPPAPPPLLGERLPVGHEDDRGRAALDHLDRPVEVLAHVLAARQDRDHARLDQILRRRDRADPARRREVADLEVLGGRLAVRPDRQDRLPVTACVLQRHRLLPVLEQRREAERLELRRDVERRRSAPRCPESRALEEVGRQEVDVGLDVLGGDRRLGRVRDADLRGGGQGDEEQGRDEHAGLRGGERTRQGWNQPRGASIVGGAPGIDSGRAAGRSKKTRRCSGDSPP